MAWQIPPGPGGRRRLLTWLVERYAGSRSGLVYAQRLRALDDAEAARRAVPVIVEPTPPRRRSPRPAPRQRPASPVSRAPARQRVVDEIPWAVQTWMGEFGNAVNALRREVLGAPPPPPVPPSVEARERLEGEAAIRASAIAGLRGEAAQAAAERLEGAEARESLEARIAALEGVDFRRPAAVAPAQPETVIVAEEGAYTGGPRLPADPAANQVFRLTVRAVVALPATMTLGWTLSGSFSQLGWSSFSPFHFGSLSTPPQLTGGSIDMIYWRRDSTDRSRDAILVGRTRRDLVTPTAIVINGTRYGPFVVGHPNNAGLRVLYYTGNPFGAGLDLSQFVGDTASVQLFYGTTPRWGQRLDPGLYRWDGSQRLWLPYTAPAG